MNPAAFAAALAIMLVGLAGTVLPIVPGIPLIYCGYLIYGLATSWQFYGAGTMIFWGVITCLTLVADLLGPMLGARRSSSSILGIWGSPRRQSDRALCLRPPRAHNRHLRGRIHGGAHGPPADQRGVQGGERRVDRPARRQPSQGNGGSHYGRRLCLANPHTLRTGRSLARLADADAKAVAAVTHDDAALHDLLHL